MLRKLRVEYSGAMYHIMSRVDQIEGLKWIAQGLQVGTWTYVSNLLNEPPEVQAQAQEVLLLCQ